MDKFYVELSDALKKEYDLVDKYLDEEIEETAKKTVKILKDVSPKRTGKYAKSWKYTKSVKSATIYSTKPHLVHLIENGHAIVKNGKVVGYAKPKKHVQQASDEAEKILLERIKSKLENG